MSGLIKGLLFAPYPTSRNCVPDLQRAFIDVRKRYFARWDPHNRWRVVVCPEGRVEPGKTSDTIGCCDVATATVRIHIAYACWGGSVLRRLLIHEICHAVSARDHGERWMKRFIRAASRAQELREPILAEAIRREVQQHRGSTFTLTPEHLSKEVLELAASNPDASFNDVITMLAAYYDNTDPTEFAAMFPMTLTAYNDV